jgi:HSP20 family molecular chaperone IbpA
MKRTVHAAIFDRGELERLRSRVGRLFVALQEASEMAAGEAGAAWLPAADVCESGECVTVTVELPGVRAEQVEVALTNEELRVRGRKRKGAPRGVISHLCSERSFGQFARAIPQGRRHRRAERRRAHRTAPQARRPARRRTQD